MDSSETTGLPSASALATSGEILSRSLGRNMVDMR